MHNYHFIAVMFFLMRGASKRHRDDRFADRASSHAGEGGAKS